MRKVKPKDSYCLLLISYCFIFTFYGCATAPVMPPKPAMGTPGVYHRVEKHQTLWRISQMYNVDLDDVARINRISDAASIEVGQLILIPTLQKEPRAMRQPLSPGDDFIWPLKGKLITPFGQTFNNTINKGINIQPYTTKDILAAREGKVIFYSDDFKGFGKTIIIDHGDGFSTVYARNAEVFVKPGEGVRKGDVIAKAGSAGRDRNIYLHFQIRKGHLPQNPLFYLSR